MATQSTWNETVYPVWIRSTAVPCSRATATFAPSAYSIEWNGPEAEM